MSGFSGVGFLVFDLDFYRTVFLLCDDMAVVGLP